MVQILVWGWSRNILRIILLSLNWFLIWEGDRCNHWQNNLLSSLKWSSSKHACILSICWLQEINAHNFTTLWKFLWALIKPTNLSKKSFQNKSHINKELKCNIFSSKVFSVQLNEQHLVVDNLDIFAAVGLGVAHDEVVPFSVKNGHLHVNKETSDFDGFLNVEFVKVWPC